MTPSELIARYIAAARSGDWDAAYAHFAEDMVVRIPGRSALAGEHRGRQVAIDYIEHAKALSRGAEVEVDLIDTLAGAERVALLVRERFHRADGPPVDIHRANVYRVVDDQIAEIWIFEGDQYAVDALLGAA
jgi:ketosteroid isomerase-like protein